MEVNCSSKEVNSPSSGLGIFHQTELSEDGNCKSPLDTTQLIPEILQTSSMCDLTPALDQKLKENEESEHLELTVNGLVNGIDKITIEENEDKLSGNKDAVESDAKEDNNIAQDVIVNGHTTTQDVIDKRLVQPINEFNANGKRRQSVADLKNMFESFSEDHSGDDELEEKMERIKNAHNGDFILDQKFDAFFESVNGCKDDNLDEDNPINSFVLKTPSKSQPPIVENESPIKLVLDMITPPPNVDMDDETEPGNNPNGNKPGNITKTGKGKPTTPATKTKEPIDSAEKAKSPSKRPPGIGYDGRPLLAIKKASTPNMSSGTARPVAAPRRNSMPATTKPTASFMPPTSKPTPTSRKLSAQDNQPIQTTPKKMETNPSTPKKTSKNSSTPKKTATKPSSVLNPTAVITSKSSTSKPTSTSSNPPSSSKPATSMSKPKTSTKSIDSASKLNTSTSKPSTATTKPSTTTTKPSTAMTKPSTTTTKPTTATAKSGTTTTNPSKTTTKPSTTTIKQSAATPKPSTATTKTGPVASKDSTTASKPSPASTKSVDGKSTVKHKGVPFLPKKVTSAAPSTTSTQSTTNGTKSTTNGTKPTSNATKATSKEGKLNTTGNKSKDNGSRPASTNPTSKTKQTGSDSSSKSSTMITITNGRTMGKKASITDASSENDAIAKHVIKKRSMPKTENIKQDKNGGKESKNYNIARDLLMEIVAKSI